MNIGHPRITRAVELTGRSEDNIPRSILWVEANADMRPFLRDPRGKPRVNQVREEVWNAARDYARRNAIREIVIMPLQSLEPPAAG